MVTVIINLGKENVKNQDGPKTINIFLSHFHFDHVMGFLVFRPLFDSSYTVNIYGYNKSTSTKNFSDKILAPTFWPVGMDILQAKINFIDLDGEPLKIGNDTLVSYALHPHPGYATSYKVETNGFSVVYTTDCEHPKNHFNKNVENIARNADVLIHDSHFTRADLINHKGWGHSSWETTIKLAEKVNVNKAVLYHYNPLYNDDQLLDADGPMIPLRGLFLIDKKGVVQHQIVNFFTLIRNVDHILSTIDSLQYFETNGEFCRVND